MLRLPTVFGLSVVFLFVLACGAGATPITYNIFDHGTVLQNGFTLSGNITIDDANNNGNVDLNEITDYTITVSEPTHTNDVTFHGTSDQLTGSHDLLVTPTELYLRDVQYPNPSAYFQVSSSDNVGFLKFDSTAVPGPTQQSLYFFNSVTHMGINSFSGNHEFGNPNLLIAAVPEPNMCGFLGLLWAVTSLRRRK
ncbi:MAG: hypothetical protein JWN24_3570 [Phycisphaerales bacterium]|nr:hypothetical protein [Phycisphaerales bacterium]